MTNPNEHESKKPILESEKARLPYQSPTLTRLTDREIGTGGTGVPEGSFGLLAS